MSHTMPFASLPKASVFEGSNQYAVCRDSSEKAHGFGSGFERASLDSGPHSSLEIRSEQKALQEGAGAKIDFALVNASSNTLGIGKVPPSYPA
jgi:hypothetical protein